MGSIAALELPSARLIDTPRDVVGHISNTTTAAIDNAILFIVLTEFELSIVLNIRYALEQAKGQGGTTSDNACIIY
jgi:hypothetical protein